jgi:hypothetical protein
MSDEKPEEKVAPADRLCSEIQLFDLCDLDRCRHKKERFCTNEELLAKFEAIKEEDIRSDLVYDDEELEDEDDLAYDDFEGDDYEEDE